MSWNHDGTETGIADLVGNIWEWGTLMKLVDGKIMMPEDNNIDLAESAWPDTGARFDATAGTSDGTGMDGNGHSGAPVISDAITKYSGLPGSDSDAFKYTNIAGAGGFRSMTKKSVYTPPLSLIFAGLAPIIHYGGAYEDGNELNGAVWVRNFGTRFPLFGASWYDAAGAGLGALNLNNARVNVNSNIGFRPASLRHSLMSDGQGFPDRAMEKRSSIPSRLRCRENMYGAGRQVSGESPPNAARRFYSGKRGAVYAENVRRSL